MNEPIRSHQRTLDRLTLGLVAVMMLPAGLQAALAPRSFFDDFPVGRGWISHEADAYNEHLVRDVGALFLAMIVVTGWTVLRRGPTRPVAAAWLLLGLMHLDYHAGHLDGYSASDRIGLLASLITVPALAACALWTSRANLPNGLTPSPQAGGQGDALVDEELIELRDALTALPSRQRSAIVLHYLCDLPDEEIAAYLKCRRSTVRTLVQRGLSELRYVNSATTKCGDEVIDTERLLRQRLTELADRAPTAVRLPR